MKKKSMTLEDYNYHIELSIERAAWYKKWMDTHPDCDKEAWEELIRLNRITHDVLVKNKGKYE